MEDGKELPKRGEPTDPERLLAHVTAQSMVLQAALVYLMRNDILSFGALTTIKEDALSVAARYRGKSSATPSDVALKRMLHVELCIEELFRIIAPAAPKAPPS
jgi:hypothetical protein